MSTSTILGFAGAAVGSFVGMPQLGFLIGSSLGGYIDYSNQRSYGPKPEDLKAISSSYGTPIPYVIGSPRIAGQVWWSSEKRVIETETEVGKGGGPTVTTYSTEVDLLIGLAEQQIAGVTRGWSNGKLVWTDLSSADDASRIASEDQNLWRRLTVYTGTYTQLPDPTYEAAVGTDLAPAYRGRAYIVLEGLQLGNSGQLPNLTWEVCSHVDASTDIVRRWAVQPSGQTFARSYSHNDGFPAIVAMQPEIRVATLIGTTVYRWDMDGNHLGTSGRTEAADAYPPLNTAGYSGNFVPYWTTNPYPVGVLSGLGVTIDLSAAATATGAGTPCLRVGLMLDLMGPITSGRYFGGVALCSDGAHAIIYTAPSNATASGTVVDQWHIVRFDVLAMSVDLVRSGTLAVTSNMSSLGVGNNQVMLYRATMLEDDLEHVWITGYGGWGETAMYAIDALGVMSIQDRLRTSDGEDGVLDWAWTFQSIWAEAGICIVVAGDSLQAFRRRGSGVQAVPLDEAVTMLCARAGMSAEQFDVTDLASVTKPVRSLAIAQVGDTRAVLDQLRTSHHFEASLSDMIYFRRRASDPVVTIPWADLGAAPNQADPQPLAITRASDLELPAQWALQYINVSDDYQSGTEYADRIISGQASATMLQLGIGMTPGEAKGVVDAIALDALAGLTTTNISLSMSYAEVEPADVVQVIDAAAATYRFRVGRRQDSAGVLKLDLVADDAAAVVSAGVTDTTYEPQGTVLAVSQTLLYLLDIPLLRDQDDGPGYYLAARGNTATWSGATVYSSTNGTDYATAATVAESAVMGVATTTLGNWTGGAVMDEVNTLTVNVAHGQLASTTRAALLADPTVNALLVGDEIIQFVTASLVSTAPNIYTVSRLLRGQRGTEWASTGHAASERVVLLRTRGMRRVSQQASDIGHALSLKGVTNGQSPASVTPIQFVHTGVSSRPIAPVDARVSRSFGGDITLTWKRRTRYAVTFTGPAGINVPLDAPAEMYDVEVYADGTYSGAQRSSFIGLTSAQCIYPFAAQFAGFGVGGPSTLYAIIYQRIGNLRSYGLRVAIPLSAAPGATSNPIAVAASPAGYIVQTGYTDANNIGHSTYWLASTAAGPYTIAQDVTSEGDLPFFNGSGGFLAQNNTHAASLVPGSLRADGSLSQSLLSVAPLDLSGAPYVVDLSAAIARPRAIIGDGARMLLFGNYNHVYASADGCRTWADLGIMAGATFPNALGSDDFLIQTVRKIGSRWFLIFGRGAPVGTLTTVYYSDDADALTGWTAVFGLDVNAVQSVMDTIVSDGTYLYAVVKNIAETTSSICRSSDGGATWSAEYAASLSAWALQCTGTTGSDKVRVYSSSGAAVEKLVGTTTWAAISSGIVNGFNHIAYGGHLFATDNAPAYSSGGSRIAYETAGAFSTVGGF